METMKTNYFLSIDDENCEDYYIGEYQINKAYINHNQETELQNPDFEKKENYHDYNDNHLINDNILKEESKYEEPPIKKYLSSIFIV